MVNTSDAASRAVGTVIGVAAAIRNNNDNNHRTDRAGRGSRGERAGSPRRYRDET